MPHLPEPGDLFDRFFLPWYDESDLKQDPPPGVRGDVETYEGLQGHPPTDVVQLPPDLHNETAHRLDTMIRAATSDWARYLRVTPPLDLSWIDAFDRHYDAARISAMLADSNPAEFTNEFLVTCCELGAALGHVLINRRPSLQWLHDWPYWDSSLWDPRTAKRINVFSWAIKKMSDYGVNDGLADKSQLCLTMLDDAAA